MDNYHLNEAVQYVRDWRTTSRGIIIVDAQITSSALQKMERDTIHTWARVKGRPAKTYNLETKTK